MTEKELPKSLSPQVAIRHLNPSDLLPLQKTTNFPLSLIS